MRERDKSHRKSLGYSHRHPKKGTTGKVRFANVIWASYLLYFCENQNRVVYEVNPSPETQRTQRWRREKIVKWVQLCSPRLLCYLCSRHIQATHYCKLKLGSISPWLMLSVVRNYFYSLSLRRCQATVRTRMVCPIFLPNVATTVYISASTYVYPYNFAHANFLLSS